MWGPGTCHLSGAGEVPGGSSDPCCHRAAAPCRCSQADGPPDRKQLDPDRVWPSPLIKLKRCDQPGVESASAATRRLPMKASRSSARPPATQDPAPRRRPPCPPPSPARGAWAVAALHAARPSPHDTHLQRCFIQNPHFLNELLQLLGAEQGDDRLAGGRGHAVVGSRGLAEALRVLPQLRKAFGGEQHQ